LRNGVSIIKIYIPRPPSLEPILNAVNATSTTTTTNEHSNNQLPTESIRIIPTKLSNIPEQPSMTSSGNSKFYSTSFPSNIRDDQPESSGDITDLDTDPTADLSPLSRTETDSLASSVRNKKNHQMV
jgi:hypothetical protein